MTMRRELRHCVETVYGVVGKTLSTRSQVLFNVSTAASGLSITALLRLNTGPISFEQLIGRHDFRRSMRPLFRRHRVDVDG